MKCLVGYGKIKRIFLKYKRATKLSFLCGINPTTKATEEYKCYIIIQGYLEKEGCYIKLLDKSLSFIVEDK